MTNIKTKIYITNNKALKIFNYYSMMILLLLLLLLLLLPAFKKKFHISIEQEEMIHCKESDSNNNSDATTENDAKQSDSDCGTIPSNKQKMDYSLKKKKS